MIGIGYMEIIVALVVMLIVLGPERMPVVVKSIAKFVREVRAVASEARAQLEDVVDMDEMRGLAKDAERNMRDAERNVRDAVQQSDVNGAVRDALQAKPAADSTDEVQKSDTATEPPQEQTP